MAEVHLARQIGPQGFVKPCVLKRISPAFVHDEKFRRMFLEEARISALLGHPHIVQTFDFGEVGDTPYMAMELVDGMNLAVLCRGLAKMNRWVPLRAAVEVAMQVADALHYAHHLVGLDGRELHLVHRDVSPHNVLVSRQGGVKLADFGIARHDARAEMTQGPSAKGKPGYMSPEQAFGQPVDGRADIFALGVVLIELISARRVIRNEPGAGVLDVPRRIRELLALRREAPPSLVQLASAMAALEPRDRPLNGRMVAEQLREIAFRMPTKDALQPFLDRVFSRYFPPESLPTAAEPTSSFPPVSPDVSSRSPAPSRRMSLEADTMVARRAPGSSLPSPPPSLEPPPPDLPAPPESTLQELQFVNESWVQPPQDDAQPAAAYGGWPAELLDAPRAGGTPPLKLGGFASQPNPPGAKSIPPADEPFELEERSSAHVPSPSAVGRQPGTAAQPAAPQSQAAVALDTAKRPQRPQGPRPPVKPATDIMRWVLIGLGVAIAGGAVAAGVLFAGAKEKPVAIESGKLVVESQPAGAKVRINGQDTGQVTPAVITNMPLEVPMRVSVALHGHVARPADRVMTISHDRGEVTASFELDRGRAFRVETHPAGAEVTFNGEKLAFTTPLELPPVPRGQSATVGLSLEGHVSAQLILRAESATATVTSVTLEPAKGVDIVTDPPGAHAFVGAVALGITPLWNVRVPGQGSWTLRLELKGYKRLKKQIVGRTLRAGDRLEYSLEEVPFTSLPLARDERERAKALERAVNRAKLDLESARTEVKGAEAAIERLQSQPQQFVDATARAQRRLDMARTRFDKAEAVHEEAKDSYEAFKDTVVARIAAEQNE